LEGEWYTLKLVAIGGLSEREGLSLKARPELSELRSLRALADSRHVVRYVTAWCEELDSVKEALGPGVPLPAAWAPGSSSTHTVVLVVQTELCHGTTLRDWLSDHRDGLTLGVPRSELQFLEHLVKACREIHRAGLVHCDLTPSSLFVMRGATLKVADFACARPAVAAEPPHPAVPGAARKDQESTRYCAPEGTEHATFATDIYSVAIIAMELLCSATFPLESEARAAIDGFVRNGHAPSLVEARLPGHCALLRRMASREPWARPSAEEALAALKNLRVAADASENFVGP
jgi:serine/threonine protein kinase